MGVVLVLKLISIWNAMEQPPHCCQAGLRSTGGLPEVVPPKVGTLGSWKGPSLSRRASCLLALLWEMCEELVLSMSRERQPWSLEGQPWCQSLSLEGLPACSLFAPRGKNSPASLLQPGLCWTSCKASV